MTYTAFEETPLLEIARIYSFYDFQFATGYVCPGERHPFWEMVYVRSGQVDIGADDGMFTLSSGDVIFHRPGEYHSIWANYAHAPDMIVTAFACDSPAMKAFEKRQLRATPEQQALLNDLLRQAERTFAAPLGHGNRPLNPGCPGGAYTLRLILTRILMDMLPAENAPAQPFPAPGANRPDAATEALIESIVSYFRANLHGELRFQDLCRHIGMSATAVKQLFHRHFEITPMAYYERIRMSEAQRLLRQTGSVSAAAYALGYSSAGYFSTRFRRVTGLTPTEYIRECLSVGSAMPKA